MHRWDRFLDDARADEQASARLRTRWLQQQAAETATLVGTLVDLAERRAAVSLHATDGRRHDGEVIALGVDFVVLTDRDEVVLVRIDAITFMRVRGADAAAASGDRAAAMDQSLAEVLARLAPSRPDVAVGLHGGDALSGALLAAGADVLTIRVSPEPDGVVYSSLPRCASVRLRSG